MKTRENFISNLRRRRKAMRLTQAQFAEKIDKAVNTYQAYEDGRVVPKPETLDKIAQILGCNPIDLYLDPSSQNPSTQALDKEILRAIEKAVERGINEALSKDQVTHEKSFDFDPKDVVERLRSLPQNTRKILLALIYQDPSLAEGTTVDSSLLSLMSQIGRESAK